MPGLKSLRLLFPPRGPWQDGAWRLPAILLLALAVRLLLFARFPALLTNDSPDYMDAAYAIHQRLDFANRWLGDVRMPGYSAFLAAIYPLTGTHSDLLVLAQSLLGLLCIPLAWAIGRLLQSPRTAAGLALFFALNPIYLLLEHALMTEALALFLMLAFTLAALRWLGRPLSPGRGFAAALLLGLCALVRVNLLPYGAVLLALPALRWAAGVLQNLPHRRPRGANAPRSRARAAPLLAPLLALLLPPLLALALTLGPWLWRNYTLYGAVSLSEHSDRSLLVWKTMSGTMDPSLPLFQHYAGEHHALDFFWLNEFSDRYATQEAEAIAAAIVAEQVGAHPGRHLRAVLRSGLNHVGIFVEGYVPRDDRAMVAFWFHALVPDPAAVAGSVPGVDDWLDFAPRTQSGPVTTLWSAAGTLSLQLLRPLLFLAFLAACLRFALLVRRGQRHCSSYQTWAVGGLIAAWWATLLFHALTLTGSDRFASLSDWVALAVVLYASERPFPAELETPA